MDTHAFCLHAAAATLMGAAIGLERQLGQHPVGLRTNALVALGADLFVSLPHLLGGTPGPAQVAGQVVTGVGFLGGGVIMREGATVKGMTTAATLWCSAAIGALTGAGLLLEGLAGTVGVLALHVCLRPLSEALSRRLRRATNVQTTYKMRVTCQAGQEKVVRALLMRFFHDHPTMMIQSVGTQSAGQPDRACVLADIHSEQRDDRAMEELLALVSEDPNVSGVQWERIVPA